MRRFWIFLVFTLPFLSCQEHLIIDELIKDREEDETEVTEVDEPDSTGSNPNCECDFIIESDNESYVFDGALENVQPGDLVCIKPSNIKSIIFKNINGSANNYVTIQNCGGQVVLGGPNVNNGILFLASRYFRLSGTGDVDNQYGIKIVETQMGTQGIAATGLSSDIEMDHIEIHNAGYTGIMIKTDPSCDNDNALRPNFTLYNVELHDLYIHDLSGEGIYLGNSFYTGTTVYCNTQKYPHDVKNVRIYNNKFENTGREAIQVGGATEDVEVYDNEIYNYGTGNVSSQNGGIQFGKGTTGKLYNNYIENGSGAAVVIQGIGENYIFNNVIVNAGYVSVNVNTRPTPLDSDIVPKGFLGGVYVMNNHLINPAHVAVNEYINEAPNNVFYNNLIVTDKSKWQELRTDTDWVLSNNLVINSIDEAGFVDPANGDYRLKNGSPAIGIGMDVSAYSVDFDFDGKQRTNNSWDIGAFSYNH